MAAETGPTLMAVWAVIFDLGGTLLDWPEWDEARAWHRAYDAVVAALGNRAWPARPDFVRAMRAAEDAHWERVGRERWSGPPSGLVRDGLARRGLREDEAALRAFASR